MKGVLLFVAGLLVGANVVYFAMRGPARPAPTALPANAPAATAAQRGPADIGSPASPAAATTAAPAPAGADSAPATVGGATTGSASTPAAGPDGALLLPVRGVTPAQLHDTFAETRDAGSRPHEALDIMAPRGTPVLAAVDGTVEKLFESVPGGLTIYEFDRARERAYYYAHLDRYADGLVEGQSLRRGDVIGYVGSTGNAAEDAPHLHFAIFQLGPDKRWWQGTAIDPYPLLAPAAARR